MCREELFQPDLRERVASSYGRVSEERATARATFNTVIPDPAGVFRIMMASPRAGNSCHGYASVGFHLTKFWRLDTHTLRSSEAKTLLSKGNLRIFCRFCRSLHFRNNRTLLWAGLEHRGTRFEDDHPINFSSRLFIGSRFPTRWPSCSMSRFGPVPRLRHLLSLAGSCYFHNPHCSNVH